MEEDEGRLHPAHTCHIYRQRRGGAPQNRLDGALLSRYRLKHISAVVHGAGLTSLQFRRADGVAMEEKKFDILSPDIIQLERKGNVYTMSVAHQGDMFVSQEISDVDLGDDVYVGLFYLCPQSKRYRKGHF